MVPKEDVDCSPNGTTLFLSLFYDELHKASPPFCDGVLQWSTRDDLHSCQGPREAPVPFMVRPWRLTHRVVVMGVGRCCVTFQDSVPTEGTSTDC